MKVAFSEIESNYDISLRFRIDNLQEFFERDVTHDTPEVCMTDTFGAGWRICIKCKPAEADGEHYLSYFFDAGPDGYPNPITWSIVGESSEGGTQYFRHCTTHTFSDKGHTWGKPKVLCKTQHWNQYVTLRRENALYIRAAIRAQMAPASCPDKCLAVSRREITAERSSNVNFMTYSARKGSGHLSKPHNLFANRDTLKQSCPQLAKFLDDPQVVPPAVKGLFSDNIEQPHRAVFNVSTPEKIPDDNDSDFEEDEEESIHNSRPTLALDGEDTLRETVDSSSSGEWKSCIKRHEVNTIDVSARPVEPIKHLRNAGASLEDEGYIIADDATSDIDSESWEADISPLGDGYEWMDMTVPSRHGVPLSQTKAKNVTKASPSLHWASAAGTSVMDDALAFSITVNARSSCKLEEEATLRTWIPQPVKTTTELASITVITVTGAASSTWEAFLFYLYSGVVTFAPLKSRGEAARKEFISDYKLKRPNRPAPCSCKSLYRLAHKLDVADLKTLALKELASQLEKDNVVAEVFSEFTSQHKEVKEIELPVLREYWGELKGTEQVARILTRVVGGELPHAAAIMAALW